MSVASTDHLDEKVFHVHCFSLCSILVLVKTHEYFFFSELFHGFHLSHPDRCHFWIRKHGVWDCVIVHLDFSFQNGV